MTLMDSKTVLAEGDEKIAIISINRPESLNALNIDVLTSLIQEFERLKVITTLRAVIITGKSDKAFVAGADVASMNGLGSRAIADYVELGQRVMRIIEKFPRPVIAAVNGFALGGGLELAMACDLIIASSNAKVGQPEVNLGIIPGFGGTQRLLQRCSVGTARYLCYTGEIISAEEALKFGIVDKVVEPESLMEVAVEIAQKISSKGPLAVTAAKEVIRDAIDMQLTSGLRKEVESFLSLFATKDREEGMQAFLQKRKPTFQGK